jgi:hypothetical protein
MPAQTQTEISVRMNPQDKAKLVDEIMEVIASEGMIDRATVTPEATIYPDSLRIRENFLAFCG